MADYITDIAADGLTKGTILWASDTIKARLVASSATPTRTMTTMTGMTAIGTDQTLGSKTQTSDTTNHREVFDAANPTWTAVAAGSTIGAVIIFKFVTNDAGSTPICVVTPSVAPATNGENVTVTFDVAGIFRTEQ